MKVLIVDDDKVVRDILKLRLKAYGASWQVRECENGEAGWSMIQEWEPDLVLLDLMLPGMTGDSILHSVKQQAVRCRTRVIVITAKEPDELSEVMALGADGCVLKPFRPEELRAVIANVMGPDVFVDGAS